MEFENFIGIDISKDTLDLALATKNGELFELNLKNDRPTIERAFTKLKKESQIEWEWTLICAEHTGHFGNKLIDVVVKFGLNLWMESAYKIIHSQGLIRGKNDRTDALRIMEYARRYQDKVQLLTPTPKSIGLLKRLSTERDLIVRDLAKFKSQLKQEAGFFDKDYFVEKKKRIEKLMKANEKVLEEVEHQIDQILNSDTELKKNLDRITAIEGVGRQTAVATLVATENFTKFTDPKKFACHSGCAPFRYESGTSRRSAHRVSHKADKNLKRIFHMAAVSTLTQKGELRQYYDRKVAEGKNKMSVINAIRAKLIARIFAVINQDREYKKNYIHSLA
jgi:transposase